MEFDRLVVGFLVDEVVGGFFISVPPGHVACVYDRGRGVLPYTWGPGLHLKLPFWQIAKLFNAQILEYTFRNDFEIKHQENLGDKAIHSTTRDEIDIEVEGSIHLKLDKNKAPQLWENVGDHFISKIVRPVTRSKIASAFLNIEYHDLKMKRNELENQLKTELNSIFAPKGLVCESVLLSDIRVSRRNDPDVIVSSAPHGASTLSE